MRIGVNCFLLQAHIGGLKQYFVSLFDWLLENDRDNEYVFFHFPHNAGELAKLASDRWKDSGILVQDQSAIAGHFKQLDLYFCPFSALWPRPVPLPSVMTLVDIQEVFYPQFFTASDLFDRASHYPSSTRAADRVITISGYSKATLVEHHGIPANKVVVAYLCADPAYFRSQEIQTVSEHPIPFTDFVFFPGNRWYHKNHDALLKALVLLKGRNKSVNAVFTGFDVEGGYPLMKRAAEYSIRERVHSAGYVTVSEMANLYLRADMLIFPSLFEGFGMPPVEAMAAGCPVAVARSTCLPEICGDAAEYFDPLDPVAVAEAICRIREDSARREALVERGRVRARQFSAERMARAHLQAFREAVEFYSRPRYLWQRMVYQPFHRSKVHALRALRRFEPETQRERTCRIGFSRGWHSREQAGSDWLRWTGRSGRLTIETPDPMTLCVRGELASIPRPNQIRVIANGSIVLDWTADAEFGFYEMPEFKVNIRAGRNVLEFVSAQPGTQPGPNDRRTLAIAVRNLTFSDPQGETSCTMLN